MIKYLAFSKIAFLQEAAHRGALVGRTLFYAVILMVYSHVWRAMQGGGAFSGEEGREMLWYLAVTEWVILSVPLVHLEMERDVRSGDIAYLLCRPASYLSMRVFEAFGSLAMRMLVLGFCGLAFAWVWGGPPIRPMGLLWALPLGILAACVNTIFMAAIGLSAFWLQDANPLSWVWQKLSFIFGGLILPISIYPNWLKQFSAFTPFYFLLFGPAQAAVTNDSSLALRSALGLFLWGSVGCALLATLYHCGRLRLQVNGG